MDTPDHPDATALATLEEGLRGPLLRPGDQGFDRARSVWNAMIDRAPAAIARCEGVADVIAGVDVARKCDLPLSIKGGGHHVSGAAVVEGGLVLDLSPMDGIRVDPDANTARVQAGATWGDVDHETQAFGLAAPGPQDPRVGVAGATLGGGVGWLSPKYGLTCDNLLSADVVTADGELVHASADEHPDLFWALRGGGGNFGVVTSFEFRLHDVGPEILAGSLVYPPAEFVDLVRHYREFLRDAPPEVRPLLGLMELPAAPYYPEEVHDERVAILVLFYGGDPDEGESVLAPIREFGAPIADSVRAREYVAWQRVGESPGEKRAYVRSQYVERLSDPVVETLLARGTDVPSAGSTVFVSPRRGAETAPAVDATAYPHRSTAHHVLVEARWSDPDRDDEHLAWTRNFHEALAPYATGEAATNFLAHDEGEERIETAYGENYDRLVEVKNAWDPANLFRSNQNVRPRG